MFVIFVYQLLQRGKKHYSKKNTHCISKYINGFCGMMFHVCHIAFDNMAKMLLNVHVPQQHTNAQHQGHESHGWDAWHHLQ